MRQLSWCSALRRPLFRPAAVTPSLPIRYTGRSFTTSRICPASTPISAALEERIEKIPLDRFRNFCIVAHVDHGKSTLSDRLLELTGTIQPGNNKQILDKLDVERERGITVKAQTCTMLYNYKGEDYLMNLVDTPGHVDFRAEVSSSFRSSDSALLLVDASQGVQAQTVANFFLAFAQGLQLIPVLNKIDLPSADPERALEQMKTHFEIDPTTAVAVSAKTGHNVEAILPAVIEQCKPPVGSEDKPLRMLLVDSWYDTYKGVILLVRIFDGVLKPNTHIISFGTGKKYTVNEVGIMYPLETQTSGLRAGMIGYCYPNMKNASDAKVGDSFTTVGNETTVEPLEGFEDPKPMVFVGAYPSDQSDFNRLDDSIRQLVTNDRSVTLQKESSEALGQGWRMGFLGTLHASVFEDRLRSEHGGALIITAPTVPYMLKYDDGREEIISNPAEFPSGESASFGKCTRMEPMVTATIALPEEYLGKVIELCEANRGVQEELTFWTSTQVILKYKLPLAELVNDFFGKLKGISKGYASLDYEDAGYQKSDIVKLQLMVNKVPVDAICQVMHRSMTQYAGKQWVVKFKEFVQREQFEVVIQAAVGNRVVARETVKAVRKDVTAKLYGGDRTRRMKLLAKQKEGKKKLAAIGRVSIEQKSFQGFLAKK